MRTLCSWEESADNGGIFWMAFEDFATQFQRVYVCRGFDHVQELNPVTGTALTAAAITTAAAAAASLPWCKILLRSAWKGPSAAGHVCHLKKFPGRKPELNPQFMLKLKDTR